MKLSVECERCGDSSEPQRKPYPEGAYDLPPGWTEFVSPGARTVLCGDCRSVVQDGITHLIQPLQLKKKGRK